MSQHKVFLVEDDEVYSFLLDTKLKEISNFDLTTFVTGEQCLENLYLAPSIIILDYSLPGIDGLETLKRIRIENEDAKVIFLSGMEDPRLIEECMDNGAYEYIVKDKDVAVKVYRSVTDILEGRNTSQDDEPQTGGFLGGFFKKKRK